MEDPRRNEPVVDEDDARTFKRGAPRGEGSPLWLVGLFGDWYEDHDLARRGSGRHPDSSGAWARSASYTRSIGARPSGAAADR